MKIGNDEYLDGGFGANNPCAEIYDEVRRMNNSAENCVGIIVSVGTGKHLHGRFQGTGLKRYVGFLNFATKWASESEEAHIYMERLNLPCYARFNVETALGSIKLDEWRYRGSLRIKTGETISKLRLRRPGHDRQMSAKKEKPMDKPSSSPPLTTPSSSSSSSTLAFSWWEKTLEILSPQKQNPRKNRKRYGRIFIPARNQKLDTLLCSKIGGNAPRTRRTGRRAMEKQLLSNLVPLQNPPMPSWGEEAF